MVLTPDLPAMYIYVYIKPDLDINADTEIILLNFVISLFWPTLYPESKWCCLFLNPLLFMQIYDLADKLETWDNQMGRGCYMTGHEVANTLFALVYFYFKWTKSIKNKFGFEFKINLEINKDS